MIQLSKEQQKIAELQSGHHVVFAPPGTGKTELLSQRVNIAVSAGIDPAQMLCLTFTNRAARNMVERIHARAQADRIFIGNFHAFAGQFLIRNQLIPQASSMLDEEDSHQLMLEAMESTRDGDPIVARPYIDQNQEKLKTDLLLLYNNFLNQRRLAVAPEIVESTRQLLREGYLKVGPSPNDSLTRSVFGMICTEYEQMKQDSLALDYDDLLNLTVHHLDGKRALHLSSYNWIQADEIQDLNTIQWHILRLLMSDQAHVVLFGDYEQSIFSFMGANHEVLKRTIAQFTPHHLIKNYRSPAMLLNMYNAYAREHLNPHWNEIPISAVKTRTEENTLFVLEFDGERGQEVAYLCNTALPYLIRQDPNPMAILTRTNQTADAFSTWLDRLGITHFKVSGFDLFRRKIVKDVMSVLGALENPIHRTSWIRLFHLFAGVPTLKESRQMVNSLYSVGLRPTDFLSSGNPDPVPLLDRFSASLQDGRVVVFDTETTGLDTATADIIQIAAVELVQGKIGREFNFHLNTRKDVGDSYQVHHISNSFLQQHGRPAAEVFKEFIEFIGSSPLVAHNLPYDWSVLCAHLARALPHNILPEQYPRFDTLDLVRRLCPTATSYKLGSLIDQIGLEGQNTHDALDDVLATARLAVHLSTLANESTQRRREVISQNERTMRRFQVNFAPIWEDIQKRLDTATSLAEVISLFCSLSRMKILNDDQRHLEKLQRHMALKCRARTLRDQLQYEFPVYQHYKESDLILEDEQIVVATVHKAKGLEWDTVIIPECNETVYPSFYSIKKAESERDSNHGQEILREEARILYVALTRAKKRILLSWHSRFLSQYGKVYPRFPSRFIQSIRPYFQSLES